MPPLPIRFFLIFQDYFSSATEDKKYQFTDFITLVKEKKLI